MGRIFAQPLSSESTFPSIYFTPNDRNTSKWSPRAGSYYKNIMESGENFPDKKAK